MTIDRAPGRYRRFAAALWLSVTLHGSIVTAFAAEVIVDGEAVPDALLDAFVRSRQHRSELCRPVPESRLHAAFVRMLLQAREVERNERQRLADELQPLMRQRWNLLAWRDAQPAGSRIREIYERMQARTFERIETLRAASDTTLARHARQGDTDALALPDDISTEMRNSLARQLGLQREYRHVVRSRITDVDIERRYDALMKAGDPRLVDVLLFKSFTILATDASAARITRIRERFERGASTAELRSTGNVPGAGSFDEPRWTRFESLPLPDENPSELRRGDVFVVNGAATDSVFGLVLITDRRHLPIVALDESDLPGDSPRTLARREEWQARLDADYRALRRRHAVTIDGVTFDEPDRVAGCEP